MCHERNPLPIPHIPLDRWRQVDAYMLAAGETVAKLGEMSVFYNDRTRHPRDIAALIITGRRQPVFVKSSSGYGRVLHWRGLSSHFDRLASGLGTMGACPIPPPRVCWI